MGVYINTFRKSKAIKMVHATTKMPIDEPVYHYAFCCKAGDEDIAFDTDRAKSVRRSLDTASRSYRKAIEQSESGSVLVLEVRPGIPDIGEKADVWRVDCPAGHIHYDCEQIEGVLVGTARKPARGPWSFMPLDESIRTESTTELLSESEEQGDSNDDLFTDEKEEQAHSNDDLFTDEKGEDLTPTWAGLMPALMLVLENGLPEGKAGVRSELMRLAEFADRMNEKTKSEVK